MGYKTVITSEPGLNRWTVSVTVNLSRAETSGLFLSGDSMLSWPTLGLIPMTEQDLIPERSGMFVSEVAAHPAGLVISYGAQAQAERTMALLREQFAQAGIVEEA